MTVEDISERPARSTLDTPESISRAGSDFVGSAEAAARRLGTRSPSGNTSTAHQSARPGTASCATFASVDSWSSD